jgi:rhomboid-like protein
MNNAGTVLAHRFVGLCLPCTRWTRPAQLSQPASRIVQTIRTFSATRPPPLWTAKPYNLQLSVSYRCRFLSASTRTALQSSFHFLSTGQARRRDEEKGLSFRDGELDGEELHDIFGAVTPPPRISNRFLRVLHGRRLDGTLDLPLPPSLQELTERYPYAMDSALHWLRETYPVDEDAAILARIEREEGNEEYSSAELQQRTQDLGLYGPQSGHYRAKLSEKEGDVYGESELDKIRAENIAKAEQEEAELQAQIDKAMAEAQQIEEEKRIREEEARRQMQEDRTKQTVQDEPEKTLTERPGQGVETAREIRPPNEFQKWVMLHRNRGQSKYKLESPEVADMTLLQRLLPSAIFVALVCAGSYLFAQYWVPPKRSERMFPDVALSFATVGTLLFANAAIFGAWGLPPFWRLLNKYFISTPAYPRAVSMLLNVFSHNNTKHLLVNMVGLLLFGLSLHEDVGRGVFLGIYMASGAVGSLASLTIFALRRNLVSSSLGASGSLWGVMSAYCWLHAE